ncbi:putative peptidoglycan binding protein [Hasllibacter halocynthiae]|uniref:Putative peptidoglycan binding protein n=1 Tax=Hasllibacter halocynthiae TaxID=595589 RepID=A0A2T0X1D7_9RHOB|nr:peptidoglycan-binding protein [Hasllibacter halocynthiae]PRY92705.1 putative peptidoglycan binding protein [Hasllibacter halocynthiae]
MRHVPTILAAALAALTLPQAARAHPGPADANGCHWDFLFYHCHQIAPQQAPLPQAQAVPVPSRPFQAEPSRQPRVDPRRVLVREVQTALSDLGCEPGPIDGAEGPSTRSAIERYEAAFGYPVVGAPTDVLLRRIRADRSRAVLGACEPRGGALAIAPLPGAGPAIEEASGGAIGLSSLPPPPNDPGRPTLTGFPELKAAAGQVPILDFDGLPVRIDGVAAAPGLTAEADLGELTAAISPEPHVTCELTRGLDAQGRLVGQCRANARDLGEQLVLAGAALDCPAESAGRYADAEGRARRSGRIPDGVAAAADCADPAGAVASAPTAPGPLDIDAIGVEALEAVGRN